VVFTLSVSEGALLNWLFSSLVVLNEVSEFWCVLLPFSMIVLKIQLEVVMSEEKLIITPEAGVELGGRVELTDLDFFSAVGVLDGVNVPEMGVFWEGTKLFCEILSVVIGEPL
jgi:hypothetical protein